MMPTIINYPEMVGGLEDIIGNILPDFGFPDKKMWNILKEIWPDENWTRDSVYDLYQWYKTGIQDNNIAAYDVNTGNKQIFNWIKANSSYTNNQVNHWAAVFKRGIDENWIDAKYVGIGYAPTHEGRQIAEGFTETGAAIINLPQSAMKLLDKVTLTAFAVAGVALVYYSLPLLTKTRKKASV